MFIFETRFTLKFGTEKTNLSGKRTVGPWVGRAGRME